MAGMEGNEEDVVTQVFDARYNDDEVDPGYNENETTIKAKTLLKKFNSHFKVKLNVELKYIVIDVQGLFLPFHRDAPKESPLSLEPFRDLRLRKNERFFPKNSLLLIARVHETYNAALYSQSC
jgi:hypothetical protein